MNSGDPALFLVEKSRNSREDGRLRGGYPVVTTFDMMHNLYIDRYDWLN
jgi:hypothetical protein